MNRNDLNALLAPTITDDVLNDNFPALTRARAGDALERAEHAEKRLAALEAEKQQLESGNAGLRRKIEENKRAIAAEHERLLVAQATLLDQKLDALLETKRITLAERDNYHEMYKVTPDLCLQLLERVQTGITRGVQHGHADDAAANAGADLYARIGEQDEEDRW